MDTTRANPVAVSGINESVSIKQLYCGTDLRVSTDTQIVDELNYIDGKCTSMRQA